MGSEGNINVDVNFKQSLNNVNVQRTTQIIMRNNRVKNLIRRLGPESQKDEAFWHKVVRNLSEDQVEIGLEIATKRKPRGMPRIKYVSGIYKNMMAAIGIA